MNIMVKQNPFRVKFHYNDKNWVSVHYKGRFIMDLNYEEIQFLVKELNKKSFDMIKNTGYNGKG